jgi:hypothetical protein
VYTPPLISEMVASRSTPPLTPAAALLRKPSSETVDVPVPLRPIQSLPVSSDAVALAAQPETETQNEFDNEYLCPYCARPTKPNDKKCWECDGELWKSFRVRAEPSAGFWVLFGFLVLNLAGYLSLFSLIAYASVAPLVRAGKLQTVDQFFGVYLGFHTLPPDVAAEVTQRLPPSLLWFMLTVLSIQIVGIVLVYSRSGAIFWFLVGLFSLNLVLTLVVIALSKNGGGTLCVGFGLVPVVFLLRIADNFMSKRERILCAPDPGIHTHSEFYIHGREYAQKKMWALAVVHFRRAAASSPGTLAYHLALATAYARLRRYERAESAWRESLRLAPDNPAVRELSDLIAEARAQNQGAKRSTA